MKSNAKLQTQLKQLQRIKKQLIESSKESNASDVSSRMVIGGRNTRTNVNLIL